MGQYFPHEQLDVYGFAVKFAGFADGLLGSWPAFRAVHDQFDRATESILINIAKAALATYLDIAGMTWQAQVERAKAKLREVMAMLAGLRGYLENVP